MDDIVDRLRIAETAPLDADGKVSLCLVLQDARAEIERLREARARVSVLKAAPAASAGGEQEPVAWGVYGRGVIRDASSIRAEAVEMQDRHACDTTIVPLYAAPPPRGWLTAEERAAVEECVSSIRQEISLLERYQPDHRLLDHRRRTDAVLSGLLARAAGGEVEE